MVLNLDLESTKVVDTGGPLLGRLESKARWVDHGHDGDWHAAVRQVRAASAAVVSALNDEEVLVAEELRVGCGLHGGHHELIFRRELLALTGLLVLFVFLDIILDLGEIYGHF